MNQLPGWVRNETTQRVYDKWQASNKKSKALAIKIKCLDCCCGETAEIKRCQITECTLHSMRPYKTNEEKAHAKLQRGCQ
jgi:hypothetical protein